LRWGILSPVARDHVTNLMLLSSGKFDTLLESVTRQIRARFPPVVANDPERTVSQERIQEIMDETFAEALRTEREHDVGLIGRVQLRSALRRELREIGYDEKFVTFAVDTFMAQLMRGAQ
jgi:hypothetical protein